MEPLSLSSVWEPLHIKGLELRNRIMMTAHVTNMARDHRPSDQHVAYYRDRARGGIALIVMGFPAVHPTSRHAVAEIDGFDEGVVPGYQAIADAVHGEGAAIIAQLGHVGRQATSSLTDLPLWAPSSIPCPWNREMPKAMELEDIDEIATGHAMAASNIKDGGLDGVEIHSGYGGYLLSSFISPYMNHRRDEFGGSRENRLRFARLVLRVVREAVGDEFVVGMQLNGSDFSPNGIDVPEAQAIARTLVDDGDLDYLTIKGSTYYCVDQNIPDMQHEHQLWVPLAAAVKQAVPDFPVFTVGRITDIHEAEKILSLGYADMVAMTRQHIADPETVNKAREGRVEDIRRCIGCNQGCLDMLFASRHVTCIHNPAAGYERELGIGTLREATSRRHVVVVGAGPAGMKTAETCARRGHRVTLLERRNAVGGQVALAAKVSGREEMGEIVRYLERQIAEAGVDVRLGVTAETGGVLGLAPDAVVVATGSAPTRLPVGHQSQGLPFPSGLDEPHVLDVWQVLEQGAAVGDAVLVADDGEGGWKGIALALALAARGHRVTMASPLAYIGAALGNFSQPKALERLFESGVELSPFTMLRGVEARRASVTREGRDDHIEPVDTVVLAGWHRPVDDLYFSLKQAGTEVHRAGDAIASRTALQAIHEGERLARAL
jgi:mycofactocin system FadH/OYE family oxidoreductase 2